MPARTTTSPPASPAPPKILKTEATVSDAPTVSVTPPAECALPVEMSILPDAPLSDNPE